MSPLSGVNVLGWGFDDPWAVTTGGGHVWVVNGGTSVTELSGATGAFVKAIRNSNYRIRRFPRYCLRWRAHLGGERG